MGTRQRDGDARRGTRVRRPRLAAGHARCRQSRAAAGAAAASRGLAPAHLRPERGRSAGPGRLAARRHALADPASDSRDPSLRRGRLPPAGLDQLDHRTYPDGAAGAGGAERTALDTLAAGGGRSAVARELRPARARGRGDRCPPGADTAPAAPGSHRRTWPARRRGIPRRPRCRAGRERLPPPTTVTWFPPGKAAMLLASPTPGSQFGPTARLRLRFSEPAASALHGRMPSLEPAAPGRWRKADAHTLEFVPRGYGFGLDGRVQLKLPVPVRIGAARRPTRTITWTTPVGLRASARGAARPAPVYPAPLDGDQGRCAEDALAPDRRAVHPPAGRFDWRYPNTPPPLALSGSRAASTRSSAAR